MKILRNPYFLLSLFLFALHQVSQKGLGLYFAWADSYLDNLVCLPILLAFWLAERSIRWGHIRLSGFEVFSSWLFLSIIFEVVFPRLSAGFTSDWRDVVFYGFGAAAFHFLINPPASARLKTIPSHGQ